MVPASWFLNPGLLGWLALGAVPIVIHLLTRRRVVRLDWAAMRFLEQAHRKTRRRIQIENLILLALRVAALILLVLAVARPFLESSSPIAGLAHSRRHVAVIVDVSASMGLNDGTGTPFNRARRAAETLIAGLEPRSGDTATIIPHASPPDPRDGETRTAGYLDPERLKGILSGLEVSDRATHLADALERARRALQSYPAGREVYLLSDLQKNGFGNVAPSAPTPDAPGTGGAGGGTQGIREALDRIVQDGAVIRVIDVGPPETRPHNVGLVSLTAPPRVVTTDQFAVIEARVKNFGPEVREVAVQFYVDHDANPRGTTRPRRIEPGAEEAFIFHHRFRREGAATVRAVLKPLDGFSADDERALVLPVRRRVKVLIVQGAGRGTEAFEAPGFFLQRALNPFADDSDVQGPFAPDVVAGHALPRVDLSAYDIVVLADTHVPGTSEIEALRTFVMAGGGLWITWGPHMDPDLARERLLTRAGLLPVVPDRAVGEADYTDPRNPRARLVLGEPHPVTRPFHADEDLKTWLEQRTAVGRYLRSTVVKSPPGRPDAPETVRVLLTYDDEAKSPALAERVVGTGRVMVLTTTAHTLWNNLPVDRQAPLFLMLASGVAHHLVVPAGDPFNLTVGEPVVRIFARFPGKRELKLPSGAAEVITPVRLGETGAPPDEARDAGSGNGRDTQPDDPEARGDARDSTAFPRFLVKSQPLMKRGVYRLAAEASRAVSGADVELFAVNPDPRESDLARFTVADLRNDVFKDVPFETPALSDLEQGQEDGPQGGELWKYLILAALACLALETVAAQRIGARKM